MLDFILNIFSTVLQMDMKDPHDIPFALPLVMASFTGFTIGFLILSLIASEEKIQKIQDKRNAQRQDE